MTDNITITKDSKILLSPNISNQIINLTSKVTWIKNEKLKKNSSNKIHPFLLTSILYEIQQSLDKTILKYSHDNFFEQNYNNKFNLIPQNILQNFRKTLKEYFYWSKISNKNKEFTVLDTKNPSQIETEKIELINTLISFASTIQEQELNLNYLADLYEAEKDLEIDLTYFLSKEKIDLYTSKYRQALKTNNIKLIKETIDIMQELILQEWQNYPTNIEDFINGNNFAFICHSTTTPNFKGTFNSNYVSCSLYNQEIHKPYNKGFGFILGPQNIVGANSHDMFIRNNATSKEDLQSFTLIPTINHPQRILAECTKLKKQNEEKKLNFNIYSEIVIQGFKPIAIFSLTNGSKEFDPNYTNARKLQKNFPNLKIIDIDILTYDKDSDLLKEQVSLIRNLELELSKKNKSIPPKDIVRSIRTNNIHQYELFFKEFTELKKTPHYSTNDILTIFKHNRILINPSLTNNEIFNGKYTDDEIKYILRKNPKFNIDIILEGNFNYGDFKTLIETLEKDTKNLNKYFPGLEEFAQITSIAKPYIIYENQIKDLKKITPLNFYTMSKYILENILKPQNLSIIETKSKKSKH